MVRRKDKNTLNYSKLSVALTFYTDIVSDRPALFILFVFVFFSCRGGGGGGGRLSVYSKIQVEEKDTN